MHDSSVIDPASKLNDEHRAAHQLIQLLKQEQMHLIQADIEKLIVVTEEKAKAVAEMATLAKIRHQALAAAGFAAQESGMQEWLKNSAATATVHRSWAELLALATSAKELNRTNGMLINKHLARNQNALTILRGDTHLGNFYGPNGQASTQASKRNLVIG